jgi:hypothetical protein
MAQVVEHLPIWHKDKGLEFKHQYTKKGKKKRNRIKCLSSRSCIVPRQMQQCNSHGKQVSNKHRPERNQGIKLIVVMTINQLLERESL